MFSVLPKPVLLAIFAGKNILPTGIKLCVCCCYKVKINRYVKRTLFLATLHFCKDSCTGLFLLRICQNKLPHNSGSVLKCFV